MPAGALPGGGIVQLYLDRGPYSRQAGRPARAGIPAGDRLRALRRLGLRLAGSAGDRRPRHGLGGWTSSCPQAEAGSQCW